MKFDDFVDKFYNWIIILLVTTIHFFYLAGMFAEFDLIKTVTDFHSMVHLAFTVLSNVIMAGIGVDKGIEIGLMSEEFKKADLINDEINRKIIPKRREFVKYVRDLTKQSKKEAQEDFLIQNGVSEVSELSAFKRFKYKRVPYTKHDIKDITLPLYFEKGRGNKIKYDASFDPKGYRRKGQLKKAIFGILTGAMSLDLVFRFDNFGNAFGTIIMLASSLIIVYFLYKMPPIYILKRNLPTKVANKYALYEGFKEYEKNKEGN